MGGKTTTSTSKVEIPQEVLARYNAVNTRAEDVAQRPFQIYSTDPSAFVAQLNQQQQQGISNINTAAGMAQPAVNAGMAATAAGMGPANLGELNVDQYMSPYLKNVVSSTADLLNQQNQQAMTGQLGTAIRSGAFGGDRSGIAAANLAQQQRMADASIFSGLLNQGFTQAQGVGQQQQGAQLAAEQANLARLLGGGQQLAGLGLAGQQAGLQGAEAQLQAGTLGQQTEQAGLTSLYNQFMQQQAYPFQVAQFLANIAMGTGALSGSTTTTTQPAPWFSDRRLKEGVKRIGESDDGLPIYKYRYKGDDSGQTHIGFMADEVEERKPEAVGLAAGYKTVDYDRATRNTGGGVMGPYSAGVNSSPYAASYVPQAYLPVGELMIADPVEMDRSSQNILAQMEAAANFGSNIIKLRDNYRDIRDMGREFFGRKAYGGGVKGPVDDEPDTPVTTETPLTGVLASQEKQEKPALQPAGAPQGGGGGGGLGDLLSGAGSFAYGMSQLLPILGFSDRRLKEGIRRVGQADNGLPIYTYRFKGDDSGKTHMGFMADEVEDRHPEAVGLAGGYKTVDYDRAARASGGLVGREAFRNGGVYPVSPAIADELYMEGAVRPRVIDPPPPTMLHTPGGLVPPGGAAGALTDMLVGSPERMAENYPSFEEVESPGLRPRRNPAIEAEADALGRAAMEAIQPQTIEVEEMPVRPAQPLPQGGLAPARQEPMAAPAMPSAAPAQGLRGGVKPYAERNTLGQLMYDPKTNKLSQNALLAILSGIGTAASSPSLYLGSALLQGVGGFANTLAGLRQQEAEIDQIRAGTEQTKVATGVGRFFSAGGPNGLPMFLSPSGTAIPILDYLENPEAHSTGNQSLDRQLVEEARKIARENGIAVPAGDGAQQGPYSLPESVSAAIADEKADSMSGNFVKYREDSDKLRTRIGEDASAAIGALPQVRMQVKAISDMSVPGQGVPSGATAPLQNMALSYVNALLRRAGEKPLSSAPSAAEVAQKIGTLAAFNQADSAGQNALGAAQMILSVTPGQELQPETNAALMSAILMENMHAIELEEFTRAYQNAEGNRTSRFVLKAPLEFAKMKRNQYAIEKPLLEKIILHGGVKNDYGVSALDILNDPEAPSEMKMRVIQNLASGTGYRGGVPASIVRYFGG